MPILFSSSWETRTFFILLLFSSRLSFFRPSTFEFFEKERSNNNYGRRLSLRYYSWRGSKGVVEGNQLVREFIKINHGSETMVTSSSYRKQYTTDRTVVTDLEALNLVNVVRKKKASAPFPACSNSFENRASDLGCTPCHSVLWKAKPVCGFGKEGHKANAQRESRWRGWYRWWCRSVDAKGKVQRRRWKCGTIFLYEMFIIGLSSIRYIYLVLHIPFSRTNAPLVIRDSEFVEIV